MEGSTVGAAVGAEGAEVDVVLGSNDGLIDGRDDAGADEVGVDGGTIGWADGIFGMTGVAVGSKYGSTVGVYEEIGTYVGTLIGITEGSAFGATVGS